MKYELWNRCDVCGQFICIEAFEQVNGAIRVLVTPDSDYSREEWETLCPKHRDCSSSRTQS